MSVFLINWDNGHDCGTFHWEYTDREKAQRDADDIAAENIAEGSWDPEGYCEVIEVARTTDPDPEPLPHMIEGTFDHFERYIG